MKIRAIQGPIWLSLALACSLACACTPQTPDSTRFAVQSAEQSSLAVADYILKVQDSFRVQAVDQPHQQAVNENIKAFEQDLAAGQSQDYYQEPDFSILLAAGSEGSFFNSKEGIEKIGNTGAVFARVVVFDTDVPPRGYKGQFSNGRFFMAGAEAANFSPDNVAYLITLDLNLDTHVFQGKLVAGSEGNFIRPGEQLPAELVAGSEGNFLRAPTPDELKANLLKYQTLLNQYEAKKDEYGRKVGQLKFVQPDFPTAVAWTETYARLRRAYSDEMGFEIARIRGVSTAQLDEAWNELIARFAARWQADCGYAVPDSGALYPQRSPRSTPIPHGNQTLELEKVIADIPEFFADLQALQKQPPYVHDVQFPLLLAKYRASHPEVFEKHHWSDKFAPPACVRPRSFPKQSPPPGPPPGGPDGSAPPAKP
ncbi:MAG: hypothetical protein ACAI44_20850 [Candidatus Sericytochromatia bacterium]